MTPDPKDAEIARLEEKCREWKTRLYQFMYGGENERDSLIAERDAALAQVAAAITGNKSGTICRDCRGVGMIHCSDPFNCDGMQPYTVEELKSALSRRDAQLRAEGRKDGLREAAAMCDDTAQEALEESGAESRAIWTWFRGQRDAILAAAEKEKGNG